MEQPAPGEDLPPLTSFSKEQWWEVVQLVKPGVTRKEFDRLWLKNAKRKMA